MPTYVLLEDIFEEMSRNISYIKLNTYLKKEKKIQFFSFFRMIFVYIIM